MSEENQAPSGSGDANMPRRTLIGAAAAAATVVAGQSAAQPAQPPVSAGPIQPGRATRLGSKVAVVTGAARGIGRAIAVELAANGADVAVLDICGPVSPASDAKPATPEDLQETVRQITALGRKCLSIRSDIRDITALRDDAQQTVRQFGGIDIVVANAAIQTWTPLLEMDDAHWKDIIEVNLNGTANTIRAFALHLIERGGGRILVLSSMQGKHGTKDGSSVRRRSGAFSA